MTSVATPDRNSRLHKMFSEKSLNKKWQQTATLGEKISDFQSYHIFKMSMSSSQQKIQSIKRQSVIHTQAKKKVKKNCLWASADNGLTRQRLHINNLNML